VTATVGRQTGLGGKPPMVGGQYHGLHPQINDRNLSYSSIQSQQLAAAYGVVSGMGQSFIYLENIHEKWNPLGTPVQSRRAYSIQPSYPPNRYNTTPINNHTSPSIDKSPTSYNSSTGGGDGYTSKLSSFSDVPDTVARQQQYGVHDSTVTLVDGHDRQVYVNGKLSTPSSPATPHNNMGTLTNRSANNQYSSQTKNTVGKNLPAYGVYAGQQPKQQAIYGQNSTMTGYGGTATVKQTVYGIRRASDNGSIIVNPASQSISSAVNNGQYHQQKVNNQNDKGDSANFSLTSSNESGAAAENNQYVTSVV